MGAMSYSLQPQSPLFRLLPREMRDRIYHFYVFEPEVLHHDFDDHGGVFRKYNGEPVDVRLMRTCKAVAYELNGLPLNLNTITFTTADRGSTHPLYSDALRLKRLLDAFDTTKWRLLYNNVECLTTEDVSKVSSHYPEAGKDVLLTLRELRDAPDEQLHYWNARQQRHNVEIRAALYLALSLVSAQPAFGTTASYDDSPFIVRDNLAWGGQKWFRSGLPTTMPRWASGTYRFPSENELLSYESEFNPTETYRFHSDNDPMAFQWFFSAASPAVQFLETLPKIQRMYLRVVILDEDEKAVHNPETRARGLIPFCQKNLRLRIGRRVGLWHHIFPFRWGEDLYGSWWRDRSFSFEILIPVVEWIMEASKLPALGMPSGSYMLTFKDCNDRHIWHMMRKTAAFQEAYLMFQQRAKIVVPTFPLDDQHRFQRFSLPCHLPDTLPQSLKDMLCGRSNMRLEHRIAGQWNVGNMLRVSESWTQDDWVKEWHRLLSRCLKTLPGGIGAQCGGCPIDSWDSEWESDEDNEDTEDDDDDIEDGYMTEELVSGWEEEVVVGDDIALEYKRNENGEYAHHCRRDKQMARGYFRHNFPARARLYGTEPVPEIHRYTPKSSSKASSSYCHSS
jgi:hypothetical protein